MSTNRFSATLVLVALASAPIAQACSKPGDLTDAEKLERIQEMVAEFRAEHPGVPSVDPAGLRRLQAERDIVLVDNRELREQNVSMIPGAIAVDEFERRADEFEGRQVVTYCTIGYRSGLYTKELIEQGWEAYNLEGSVLAWLHAGGEVVDADGPTKRLHVYGRRWDLAPSDYESEW